MKAAIVVFPGSNRERDAARALALATGEEPLHVWHGDSEMPAVDLVVLPGGFSYGDYLRAGAMAAQSPIMREVKKRAEDGVAVLGICNGFQILTEAQLLPGALLRNAQLKFMCRKVDLRVETSDSPYTRGYNAGQVIRVPVAHADGNYFADDDTVKELEDEDRVAFRYCGRDGEVTPQSAPNGSVRNIAGVLSKNRRVLGLMPHPEDAVEPAHGSTDGRALFAGLIEALA